MLEKIIQNPKSIMAYDSKSILRAIAICEDAKLLKEFSKIGTVSRQMKSSALARWNDLCWQNRSLTEEERDAWSPGGVTH